MIELVLRLARENPRWGYIRIAGECRKPDRDPRRVPAEAIIEAEPDQWWTYGRRIRIGATIAAGAGLDPATADPKHLFAPPPPPFRDLERRLPPPYERLGGGFDGLALWHDRVALGLAAHLFTDLGVPAAPASHWRTDELVYEAAFPLSDDRELHLPRHRGGTVDWFSADAAAAQGTPAFTPPAPGETTIVYPTALRYPGSPVSRWWEIEDGTLDIGGYPPDASHFATILLIDLIASHSDDWFMIPINGTAGNVITLQNTVVTDSFGLTYPLTPPADWWLFRSDGLDDSSLTLWLCALVPLQGRPIEDVLIGLDEYSNLLWAVERQVSGHTLAPPIRTEAEELANPLLAPPTREPPPDDRERFVYVPGRDAAHYWHPYQVEDVPDGDGIPRRRFVQRRLADVTRVTPGLLPAPTAEVLRVRADATEVVHEIAPSTVPSIGVILERRHSLARDVDGNPILWLQRQRTPFLNPPSKHLRFDVFADDSAG